MSTTDFAVELLAKVTVNVNLFPMQNRVLTPQLFLNWTTRILFFTSMSALLPTLPNYLVEIGGNKSQIGIVMSAFALGVLIFRPMVGKKVDSLGRKIILIIGVVIYVISPIIYIYIQSIPAFIPIRIFHGIGLAAFGTASITLITDAAPDEKRGEVLSYTGMVNTIAFALGPVLGSFVADHFGYTELFITATAVAGAALILSIFIKETKEKGSQGNRLGYREAVMHRPIILSFLIILLIAMTHGAVFIYFPIFIKENLGINIGLFFLVFGTSTMLIRIVIGRISDRWGRGPLIMGAIIFMMAGVLLFQQSTTLPILIVAAIVYGFGFGAQQPTLTALVADYTTPETRGKIFSFYYGGFDLGISLTGIVLGAVAENFGIPRMFILCSFLTGIALILFAGFFEKTIPQSLRFAFSLDHKTDEYTICDQYMEVTPEQAEEFFRNK